jgi:hypothetical protein
MFRRITMGMVLYSIPTLAFAQAAEPVESVGQNLLATLFLLFLAGVVAVGWLLVGLLAKAPTPFPTARALLEPNLAWALVGAVIANRIWSGGEIHGALDFAVAVAGGVVLLELGRAIGQVRFPGVPVWQAR